MRIRLAWAIVFFTSACSPEWAATVDVEGGFSVLLPTASPDRDVVDASSFYGPGAAAGLDIGEVHTVTASAVAGGGAASRIVRSYLHEPRRAGVYRVFFAELPTIDQAVESASVLQRSRDAIVNRFRLDEMAGQSPVCSRELVRESVLDEYSPPRLEFWYEQTCTDDAPLVVLVRSQILVSGERLYGLEVHGPKADTHSALTFEEASSEDAEVFFASFAIHR